MVESRKEALGWKAPQKACEDRKCPFHGELLVKNELFQGVVIKKDSNRSATLEWNRSKYVPKYERYTLLRSRLRVHNPACVNAQIGEEVVAARTKPLSKTKHHVIIGRAEGGKA
ncbi:30S ribosomal protein S17 [Candidatus Woesearchaeota archaeon]|nr:30S ribosomal protein S17 [Candidatus Woesearchaeota archaeon]